MTTPPTTSDTGWLDIDVPTPALVMDVDILNRNLDEMAQISAEAGVALLPHAKTHRIAEVGRRQVDRGAHGLTVATVAEAERFVSAGIAAIFIANPIAGADKFQRCRDLSQACDLTLAIDTIEGVRQLGEFFAAAGDRIKVMLAIDTGLGREGVRPDTAAGLAEQIDTIDGVELVGIYTHEGTVYGALSATEVVDRSRAVAEEMVAVANRIRDLGIALPIVSMGASASARVCARVPGVTQIRPGIYAFNDAGQVALKNATTDTVAVRVLATVTSHPEPSRACIDTGSKALSADLLPASALRDQYPGHGIVVNAPGWVIDRVSEEHGWMRWHGDGEPSPLPVGTRLEIIPNHVCMAFAMLRRAHVIQEGQLVDSWDCFGPGN